MRFLIDNSLSPKLSQQLREAGHDSVHLREVMAPSSPDDVVIEYGRRENRIVVAADTDFGTLLAQSGQSSPSVILFRTTRRSTEAVYPLLAANLPALAEDLAAGCVAVIEDSRIRVRRLPIS